MDGPANAGNTDAGVMPSRLQLAMIGQEFQDVARYAMPPFYCGITLASRQPTEVRQAGPEPEHLLPLSADTLALTRVRRPGWRLLSRRTKH